jgi:hypothetical protein
MSIIYRIKTLVSIDQKRQYCDEEAITENQQKKLMELESRHCRGEAA